ncbi:MAG: SLC13 family permease [Bryobacteraceae bacterium]|nr:SLC13 family permease [Bryobacteraceae bacterium]
MIGPGAILSTALIAPYAMNVSARAGISPFLTALMVGNGANAGNLSPFSTIGAIVTGLMTSAGLGGHEFRLWFFHASASTVVALAAYLALAPFRAPGMFHADSLAIPPIQPRHVATLAVTAAWIAAVLLLRAPLGWTALAGAAILLLARIAPARASVTAMPWKVIAMVVTISTAVGYLEKAGGLSWFQDAVARLATPHTVHAVVAFLTGAISAYSSTSSVVLPAFIPLVPGVAARLPGTDPLALAITVNIGSSLVDVSPLSTIGALCIAAAPPAEGPRLFRKLLIWGLSMSFVGAALCYLAAPLFRLP